MKHELLSPAGDMESLYQAINNGCDAIYAGLKNFGARHFAKNFTEEEIVEAIKLCHLYGVKLYVTMNILVKEGEVDSFIDQIDFLYKNGVDAVIMQDFGMICLVREMFPNLEVHVSTQANSSTIDTIKLYKSLGVKRIVLPREMSIDEINSINIDIEKEVFIHGALCISYSGNCLMSSMLGGRSGNRGECVGSCRLKYSLEKDGKIIEKDKYLLSTKEFNTSHQFKKLLNSNIYSFKIEGRMKSPEYVGFITSFYRKIIDGENFDLKEEEEKLKVLFNRRFTTGNLFESKDIMNIESPNHIGIKIGKVIKVDSKYITVKLDKELNQEDGIRFMESNKGFIANYLYNEKKRLVNSASEIVMIDNKIGLTTKDTVYKTIDRKLIKNLQNMPVRKIKVDFKLEAKIGNKLILSVTDGENVVTEISNVVEKAKTSSISKERIISQLKKLGSTPYECSNINLLVDDNIFISIKELNNQRRIVIDKLTDIRKNKKGKYIRKDVSFSKFDIKKDSYLTGTVFKEEQLLTCLKLNFRRIYTNNLELYNKYKNNDRVYYKVDNNVLDIEKSIKEENLVNENIYFKKYKNTYGSYFLNITNIYTAYYLIRNNLLVIPVSVELSDNEIEVLYKNFKNKFSFDLVLEILVYGRVCNMVIKGNILNLESGSYNLIDQKGRKFPVYYNNKNTHILNCSNNYNKHNYSFPYIKRFDFYDENASQIEKIVNQLK